MEILSLVENAFMSIWNQRFMLIRKLLNDGHKQALKDQEI